MVDDLWLMVWSLGFTRRLRKLGQRGCHRLDELLLPMLRIENIEVLRWLHPAICSPFGRDQMERHKNPFPRKSLLIARPA